MSTEPNFFDFANEPRFVDSDNRKNRKHANVNTESLNKRHRAMLPRKDIEGKTILDLGAGIGATGYWCLENGATHYTAVETQALYSNQAKDIFSSIYKDEQYKIIQASVEEFLEKTTEQYDVVVLAGVLHAFIDIFFILKHVARIAKGVIIIDSHFPYGLKSLEDSFIYVNKNQSMNSSKGNFSYLGAGSTPSPEALRVIMGNYGFDFTGFHTPEKMSQEFHDAYHEPLTARGSAFPLRFVVGFKKSFNTRNNNFSSVSDNLQNETGKQISFDYVTQSLYPENKPNKSWQFKGENVKNFQKIAETNIQDYEAIIEKCLSIAKRKFPNKGNRIVDIGSARGYTLEKFYNAGYTNLFGIDNSQEMLDNSFKKATLILSEIFPDKLESIDMAIANWTLHFIQNRKEYIQSIYDSLQEGGVFVLSDKVTSPKDIHDMYHDFKRKNGLTEEQIREKESSIVGVLVPYPLEWYFTTLQEIGFKDISIIDAGFSFVTIYCTK